jgi:acyl transferase domain-containing protein
MTAHPPPRGPRGALPVPSPLVYLLPGQGIHYAGCADLLYAAEATFRREIDRAAEHLQPLVGIDVRSVLCRPAREVDREVAARTSVAQPALLAYGLSLVVTLSQSGVRADCLVGHSLGELTCAAVAGAFNPEVALDLAAARGRLMEQSPAGAMLSPSGSPPPPSHRGCRRTPQPGFAGLVKLHPRYASQSILSLREPATPYLVTPQTIARVAAEVRERGYGCVAAKAIP